MEPTEAVSSPASAHAGLPPSPPEPSLASNLPPPAPVSSALPDEGDDDHIHILAVDDDRIAMAVLKKMLLQLKYTVTSASGGKEALALLHNSPEAYDIVLLDRMMPEIDGIATTIEMKKDPLLKYIPVVMQTGADSPEEVSQGIEAGVFYYLTKPLQIETLASVLHRAGVHVHSQRLLRYEMQQHSSSFRLMQAARLLYSSLEEAEGLARFLANCYPDPERALPGLSELMVNAVEHGNLAITYEEKATLLEQSTWRETIIQRQKHPDYVDKTVEVLFERKSDGIYIQITDQGAGLDWKQYLNVDPSRALQRHGRGIAMANMVNFDKLLYNETGNQVTAIIYDNADDYWG